MGLKLPNNITVSQYLNFRQLKFQCFAALLLHGALPDLSCLHKLGLSQSIISQYSVPHAIIKYRYDIKYV